MNSDTFCVNPWISLHSQPADGFNPCCLFRSSVKVDTVDDYLHSDKLKLTKQKLLNGERIPDCSTCWSQENAGYISKRQRDNKVYGKIFQALNKDLHTPHGKFVEYYLRLGNHCNLRCTSCSDKASSGWISENKKFNIPTRNVVSLESSADVWSHLKNNAATIGVIEFIGGEPFMINVEQQVDLLKWLVDHNHAKHIRIKYNTNGTRMPTEQLDFWKFFKAVEINVSVDSIKEQFEYLRFPANWHDVDSNIKWYQQLQNTIPQLELTVITTISILTIGYINDLLSYCRNSNLNVFVNMLEYPAVLNLYNFDSSIKDWIASKIEHVDHPVIKNIFNNLHTNGQNTIDRKTLLNFLTTLDSRRDLDARKTFPDLLQCLESTT